MHLFGPFGDGKKWVDNVRKGRGSTKEKIVQISEVSISEMPNLLLQVRLHSCFTPNFKTCFNRL